MSDARSAAQPHKLGEESTVGSMSSPGSSAAQDREPTRIPMGGVDKCLLCGWQGQPDEPHGCPRYTDSAAASVEREWVIYRSSTHTQVYVGIKADSRDGALAAFFEGQGELSPDRERWSAWDIDAVDVYLPGLIEETT